MYIGTKVKQLRKSLNMTLVELSSKSGVQIATLSRIENNKMTGTLESHMNIAKALGISVTDLYSAITREGTEPEAGSANGADVFRHSDKSSYEILSKRVLARKMMPILLKIEPGGETNIEEYRPGAERFVFVLEGKLEIRVQKETYVLERNHTLHFDASLPHRFVNVGKSRMRALSVMTPVTL